ncbi:unnamed protein product [Adineta steineri]|uniref:FAS1 domain-containing protein n=1 Tax=Adineta steineri TaxID=433720 RepID=A0A814JCK5_9BILA|nr:unnamed protein product [Adineta steineri]CAF1036235.1 unnamed protein product [Adineta steineri]CAF1104333.1 unnamed protein product [Adineta steineri]
MNSKTILILFVTLLHFTVTVLGQHPNIWQIISTDDRLTTLATALKAAGLDESSQQAGSLTVFAPTDTAFSKVSPEIVQHLSDPQNKNELAAILLYHAIGDRVLTSANLMGMNLSTRLETLAGGFITITKQGNQVKINNATVIAAEILASNGIIHIIDAVLMPLSSST